jgi:hypothetical protein
MNGTLHEFVAGDRSHPMSIEIYSKLDKVLTDLKNAGYVPDVTEVFVQVTEEEKQKVLYWHSEKLAVAFALLSSESCSTIRIVKNLRMCLDCHNSIKLISKLYTGEVVVRDRHTSIILDMDSVLVRITGNSLSIDDIKQWNICSKSW